MSNRLIYIYTYVVESLCFDVLGLAAKSCAPLLPLLQLGSWFASMAGAGGGGGDAGDSFYSDFMVLRPDKGGLYALFHLMWSCKVSENAAVDCPAGTEMADWRRRWAVLVSLVAQVLLLWAKKPMALVGRATEYWMNLVNENGGGVLVLVLRALQGRSTCFHSCITFTPWLNA